MLLEKIRTIFPEANRTQEQDLLIGSSCLALTNKERETIENLNFDSYQYSEPVRDQIASQKADAIVKAQVIGAVSGAAIGCVAGAAFARNKFNGDDKRLPTLIGGLGGALAGAAGGYFAGKEIGSIKFTKDLNSSVEYKEWKNKKYEDIIFPALSRYVDPIEWDRVQLICPITLGWMREPVRAEDHHFYEKSALIAHLHAWEGRQRQIEIDRQNHGQDPFTPEERLQALQTSSPFRNGNVTMAGSKEFPDYYHQIFEKLKFNYNIQVTEQHALVTLSKTVLDQLGLSEPFSPEIAKVVKFYEKTQRERSIISGEMYINLLRSPLISDASNEELKELNEFINATSELPRLLN